jgi:hypothetical protein
MRQREYENSGTPLTSGTEKSLKKENFHWHRFAGFRAA